MMECQNCGKEIDESNLIYTMNDEEACSQSCADEMTCPTVSNKNEEWVYDYIKEYATNFFNVGEDESKYERLDVFFEHDSWYISLFLKEEYDPENQVTIQYSVHDCNRDEFATINNYDSPLCFEELA